MAFFPSVIGAFKDIIAAPFLEPRLWWQLAPVLGLWLLLEIYLAKNKDEDLGWNSALANAITLFWITLAAIQPLFFRQIGEAFAWPNFIALCVLLVYALFLTYISFRHTFGEHITYLLAAPTIVHYLAIFSILWGNKVLAMNQWVLLVMLLLWCVIYGVRWLIVKGFSDY